MKEPLGRRWFRFGLGTAMLLIACLAAVFAGFRTGYDRGLRAGQHDAIDLDESHLYYKVYNVRDMIGEDGQPSCHTLIELIRSNIAPQLWSELGGPFTIVAIDDRQLVITASDSVHEDIRKLFDDIHSGRH